MRSTRGALAFLIASAAVACGGDDLVLPEDGVPTSIVPVSGNNQSGTVRAELPSPVTVRVLDTQGRPVGGQEVTFTVITGGGSVAPVTVMTNDNGEATIEWTLGGAAGTQQVRAQATGGAAPDDLSIMLSAVAGASNASSIEMVSGNEQSATAGSALEDSLIVRTEDAEGNPVGGVTVAWTLAGGGSVSEASTVTGLDGRTGVRRILGPTAGQQTTTATVAGLSGSPVTFTAVATVGSAGRLVVVQQPSATAASGAPFAQQPRVQVQDVNGNNVAIAGRAITAELVSGPAGATLQGVPTVATNGSGLATFTNLAISGPAGSYTLNFTGANLTGATSTSITLTAGAATRLAFTTQPTNTTAGAAITPPVRVTVQDALGQTVTTASNSITISLGTNPSGATLGGTRTVNAVNGVATFSNLTVDRAGAGYTLSATSSGLTGGTSAAFTVTSGGASAIAANGTVPATTTVGAAVSPAPSVRVTDASGNPVAGVTVTFAPVGGGSVTGGTQTTNAQGVATVGSWTIGATAGAVYQLRATAAGVTGEVLFETTGAAGSAGLLTIETQPPATTESGAALIPQPAVQLRDASGNAVAQGGVAVTASIASGSGGSLSGATENTNASGRATFDNLILSGPPGNYTIQFSSSGVTPAVSQTVTIVSGGATKLAIAQQPSSTAQSGEPFAQQPIIQLQDAAGNPVATAGVEVLATISSGGGTLTGTTSVETNADGRAVFTNLEISGVAGTRRLLFAASGLTSVTSNDIVVVAGPVSEGSSSISAEPGAVLTGNATTITVTLRDASGNAVPGVSISLTSDGAGAFGEQVLTSGSGGTASTSYTPTLSGPHTVSATADGATVSTIVTVSDP